MFQIPDYYWVCEVVCAAFSLPKEALHLRLFLTFRREVPGVCWNTCERTSPAAHFAVQSKKHNRTSVTLALALIFPYIKHRNRERVRDIICKGYKMYQFDVCNRSCIAIEELINPSVLQIPARLNSSSVSSQRFF